MSTPTAAPIHRREPLAVEIEAKHLHRERPNTNPTVLRERRRVLASKPMKAIQAALGEDDEGYVDWLRGARRSFPWND